jgi:hypothetical protein
MLNVKLSTFKIFLSLILKSLIEKEIFYHLTLHVSDIIFQTAANYGI